MLSFIPRLTHTAVWTPLAISNSSLRRSEVWRHVDEYWTHKHSRNATVSGGLSLLRPAATISLTMRSSPSLSYFRVRLWPLGDFKKGRPLFRDCLLLELWRSVQVVMQELQRIISLVWLVVMAEVEWPSIQGTAVMPGSGAALFTSFNSKKETRIKKHDLYVCVYRILYTYRSALIFLSLLYLTLTLCVKAKGSLKRNR